MFESGKTDNFKRAFTEYANEKQQDIEKQPTVTRQQLRENAQRIQEQEPKKKEKFVKNQRTWLFNADKAT